MTVLGVELNWYLSHCARQGNDTMALVIMPVDMAENLTKRLESIAVPDNLDNSQKAYTIRNAISGYQGQNGVYYMFYHQLTGAGIKYVIFAPTTMID